MFDWRCVHILLEVIYTLVIDNSMFPVKNPSLLCNHVILLSCASCLCTALKVDLSVDCLMPSLDIGVFGEPNYKVREFATFLSVC
jgi:predicted ferric reductase